MSEIGPLYHWSPRDRLASIRKLGLVPGKRNFHGSTYINHVTSEEEEYLQPSVSFSLDAATAWNYSHGCWKSEGEFDLWMVVLNPSDEVHVQPCWGSRINEIRVANRIPKKRLTWIGERKVEALA